MHESKVKRHLPFFPEQAGTDLESNKKGFKIQVGSKSQVFHGTAYMTRGRVTKDGLIKNKNGRIVFKDKAEAARKSQNLLKAGYTHRRDHIFGAVFRGRPLTIKGHNGDRVSRKKNSL